MGAEKKRGVSFFSRPRVTCHSSLAPPKTIPSTLVQHQDGWYGMHASFHWDNIEGHMFSALLARRGSMTHLSCCASHNNRIVWRCPLASCPSDNASCTCGNENRREDGVAVVPREPPHLLPFEQLCFLAWDKAKQMCPASLQPTPTPQGNLHVDLVAMHIESNSPLRRSVSSNQSESIGHIGPWV